MNRGLTVFTFLGSFVSCNNDISQEVKKMIFIVNRCFYGPKNQLKSHVLSWRSKIILYKTLIRTVLTYTSETLVLSTRDEKLNLREKSFEARPKQRLQ
jgi:hypothetical protein